MTRLTRRTEGVDVTGVTPPADPDQLAPDAGFVVATGIECSAPRIAGGLRRDELRLTGHWERYADDFGIAADMGIRWLRYGIPFHVVAADPVHLDWKWTDGALGALHDAGLEPIADLLHFGVPDDLWGIGDPRLPDRYRRFVEAFVRRYPWVRAFTPVNEPWITATLSAGLGHWNERRSDPGSHVTALDRVLECAVSGAEIVRAARSDAVVLQNDVCERWIAGSDETAAEAALLNELRFAPFELLYGREPHPLALEWLTRNGMSERRLSWFADHGSEAGAVVGHDYYAGNEHVLFAPGHSRTREPLEGYASLAAEYHRRLGLPFFLAETNIEADRASDWLAFVWNDALSLRDAGLPIRGVCWYSLTDQVDWDTALSEANDRVNALGLVDLDRRERPVGAIYRRLARDARQHRLEPLPNAASTRRLSEAPPVSGR